MLPSIYRLKKRMDFKKVYNHGKSQANPFLVLYARPLEGHTGYSRIGFSVSKRLGGAVERNKIKRRLREAARHHLPAIRDGYDIIFIARIKIKGISFLDVEKNMLLLLKRARLLKDEG